MEQHTVEVTFEGELVSSVADEGGTMTLYRTPEDTYFMHIDTRHVAQDVAQVVGRDAVLEVGCSPHGLPEDIIRSWYPDLWEAQSRQ
jgi:hypothetical protein